MKKLTLTFVVSLWGSLLGWIIVSVIYKIYPNLLDIGEFFYLVGVISSMISIYTYLKSIDNIIDLNEFKEPD